MSSGRQEFFLAIPSMSASVDMGCLSIGMLVGSSMTGLWVFADADRIRLELSKKPATQERGTHHFVLDLSLIGQPNELLGTSKYSNKST
jgi:hypothetical protein